MPTNIHYFLLELLKYHCFLFSFCLSSLNRFLGSAQSFDITLKNVILKIPKFWAMVDDKALLSGQRILLLSVILCPAETQMKYVG